MSNIGTPDIKDYKRTAIKKHIVYACMPEINTMVTNALEQTFYATNENQRVVISGVRNELTVTSLDDLMRNYTKIDETPLTKEYLKTKMKPHNGIYVMKWTKFLAKEGVNTLWAKHVPLNNQFLFRTENGQPILVNSPKSRHAKGDFIVYKDNGSGYPDFNSSWCVNGEVFPTKYNMKRFANVGLQEFLNLTTPEPCVSLPPFATAKPAPVDENVARREERNRMAQNMMRDLIFSDKKPPEPKRDLKAEKEQRINSLVAEYIGEDNEVYNKADSKFKTIVKYVIRIFKNFSDDLNEVKRFSFDSKIIGAECEADSGTPRFTLDFDVINHNTKEEAIGYVVVSMNPKINILLGVNKYGMEDGNFLINNTFASPTTFEQNLVPLFKKAFE